MRQSASVRLSESQAPRHRPQRLEVPLHVGAEIRADLVLEVLREHRQDVGARARRRRQIELDAEQRSDALPHRKAGAVQAALHGLGASRRAPPRPPAP